MFVIPIEAKTIVQKISASGTIQPEKSIDISANISALIMRIFVDDGDSVMMGQNLISLDKTRYEAFAEQAASRLRSAEANLEKTIVLTGAMIPYKFGSSDGLFNFGGALALPKHCPMVFILP